MGYSLSLGEAEIDYDIYEDDHKNSMVRIGVRGEKHDEAPAFGEPTDYTNARLPSYTQWHAFCEFTQLIDVFYEGNDFCGGHPGVFPITKQFQTRIRQALKAHKMRYPNAVASYEREKDIGNDDYSEKDYMADGCLCRLEWLKYWTDWAIENCKCPVFCNT